MITSALWKSSVVSIGLSLALTAIAEAAWFWGWLQMMAIVLPVSWPYWAGVGRFLLPTAIFPLLYAPLLARAIAIRLSANNRAGRIAFILAVAGTIPGSWWAFLWLLSGWLPRRL